MNKEILSKLIISSHGGALDPLLNTFNHEEKIADTRVVWGALNQKHQQRLLCLFHQH